jgi:LPS export ABC transporter protein LptC
MTGGLLEGNLINAFKWFCLFAFVFFQSCEDNEISKIKALTSPEETGYDLADSAVITYSEYGWKRAVMVASLMKKHNKNGNGLEFPKGIKVDFFEKEKKTATLTADYAFNDDATKTTKLKGNVKMVNVRNEVLRTDEIIWDMRNKLIHAPGWIKIKTKEEMIVGVGLDSDEDLKNYTIKKVNGIFTTYDNQGFK